MPPGLTKRGPVRHRSDVDGLGRRNVCRRSVSDGRFLQFTVGFVGVKFVSVTQDFIGELGKNANHRRRTRVPLGAVGS